MKNGAVIRKTVWQLLRMLNMELLLQPSNSVSRYAANRNENTYLHKNKHMFIAALFKVAKKWKQLSAHQLMSR